MKLENLTKAPEAKAKKRNATIRAEEDSILGYLKSYSELYENKRKILENNKKNRKNNNDEKSIKSKIRDRRRRIK